jgi:hypothetical protein
LPPATLSQTDENIPANARTGVLFWVFLRIISKISKKSNPLKLSSRQVDSTSKMMRNDGALVLTAAHFRIFTSLVRFSDFGNFKCET